MNLGFSEICPCWLPHPLDWCSSIVEAVFSHTRLLALSWMLKSLLGLGQPKSLGILSRHTSSSMVSEHFAVVRVFPEKDKLDELGEVEGSVWFVERSACSRGMNGTFLSRSLCLCLSCRFPGNVPELEKSNMKFHFFSASSLAGWWGCPNEQ